MNYLSRDKYLTKEEQELLNTKLTRDRDSLMVTLALKTGARASELLNITKSSITLVDDCYLVFIKGIKGSSDREIPIPKDLAIALLELPGDKLFNISYPRLDQIWDKFKPNGKKFHSLRHTFAVNLYQKSRDIKLVQVALGHKSLTNTLIYAALVDGLDKLKQALV